LTPRYGSNDMNIERVASGMLGVVVAATRRRRRLTRHRG
jgi:hypothetical protein